MGLRKDIVFRGCTRPPMFMGVPYVPFFIGAGGVLLLAMYTNLFFLLLMPCVIFVMRQFARRDEMIFRLIGLKYQIRARIKNVRARAGIWHLTPNDYKGGRN